MLIMSRTERPSAAGYDANNNKIGISITNRGNSITNRGREPIKYHLATTEIIIIVGQQIRS